ncbi:MAG TPA: prepilin-type N-terminal cleavage/methylation domain-containing protein [Terriglobia bacterium]|nr:prepilin-type N-terminal cleavage/methylation domain-containing protein [Terriglobia bacterium]
MDKKRRQNLTTVLPRNGFSLMEVLVAIAVLGIVFTTAFSLMTTSLRNVNRIEEREKVVRYGQMKLNEMVLNVNQGKVEQPLSGSFDQKFQWQAQIETYDTRENALTPPPFQVLRIRLSVIWQSLSRRNSYVLETLAWTPVEVRTGG